MFLAVLLVWVAYASTNQMLVLRAQVDALQEVVAALSRELEAEKAQFDEYKSAYMGLREAVNERWKHSDPRVFVTPEDRAVQKIIREANLTGDAWRDLEVIFKWMLQNIKYRGDGVYPILPHEPSETLVFCREIWQFPNETLSLLEGDCEDMALLLCSLIRSYGKPAECISIRGSEGGHMAVQVPTSNGEVAILDPAGRYCSCSPEGRIRPGDVEAEVNAWLSHLKMMGENVRVTRVFSDRINRTFNSTREYVDWMRNRREEAA
jgi:hypothetical protein